MRKVIAAFNITLDGFCDHTAVNAGDEILHHYNQLLSHADVILYGRITYQLMEYWQPFVNKPTGNKAHDDFAVTIDKLSKIVFSKTLQNVAWKNTRLACASLKEEISMLKQQPGGDILVGSRSLIVAALNLNLIDELQLCIHPVIAGKGLPFFENIKRKINLDLLRTNTLGCGAVIQYYSPNQLNS